MVIRKIFVVLGWIFIALFVAIGIMASIGQIPPGQDSYNSGFEAHPILTLMHVVPGIIFMVLGPLQFMPWIRSRFINFHRWCGRIFLINSILIGLSGLLIVLIFPFAGLNEQLSIFFFASIFLFSIYKAYYHIRRFEIEQHREWMIRVFSIGLGIAMIRVFTALMSIFTTYKQIDFFAWAFWGGFGITWIIGEIWIAVTRKKWI